MTNPLIQPSELSACLGEVSLLDVRWSLSGPPGREEYLRGHIAGATFVDLGTELADPPGERGRHPLPDVNSFQVSMRAHGISGDRPVVVYDTTSGTSAARCWWLLRYFGHRDVRLLDGGLGAWEDAGGSLERGTVAASRGDFTAVPGQMPVLDAEWAGLLARNGVLVDARAPERFRGEVEPMDPVAGHIPGAVNVPTSANLDGMVFAPPEALQATYAMAGIDDIAQVGVYCGSGVTAAHDVLALELIGIKAALYPGSWSEWVHDGRRPVEAGDHRERHEDGGEADSVHDEFGPD